MRNYPDLIEGFCQMLKEQESPLSFKKWTIISLISAAIERRVWIERGFEKAYPHLFITLVAPAGVGKKSTMVRIARRIYGKIPGMMLHSDRINYIDLLEAFEEIGRRRFSYEDYILNYSYLYLCLDCIHLFIESGPGRFPYHLSATLEDSDNYRFLRVRFGRRKKERIISRPTCSILTTANPDQITKFREQTDFYGLCLKKSFLIYEYEDVEKEPYIFDSIAPEMRKILEDLVDMKECLGPMQIDEETKKAYHDWYPHYKKLLSEADRPLESSFLGHLSQYILKLAMIRSLSLSNDMVIKKDHFDWAVKEFELIWPNHKRLISILDSDKAMDLCHVIETKVKFAGVIDLKTLHENLHIKISMDDLRQCLENMQTIGVVKNPNTGEELFVYKKPFLQKWAQQKWGRLAEEIDEQIP